MDSQQFKYPATPRAEADALKVLIGGILGMVVAMGIGRFIFTPILPLMQRDLGMTNSVAGWLAGLNYLGYLAGAIVCSVTPGMLRSWLITGGSLFVSIATTLFMGATISVHWWGLMRFAGGFASAVLFIVITAEVGETLSRRGYGHWLGALYGGVGLGIAISGLVVPPLDNIGGWIGAWYGAGLLAAILAVIGLLLGRRRELVKPITIDESRTPVSLSSVRLLAVGYFFEGLGYIVTATFLVAIISMTPGLEDFAPYSWVAVGLAAVPSTIFWPYLGRRIGNRKALLGAYLLQADQSLRSTWERVFATVNFLKMLAERERLNSDIQGILDQQTDAWGIKVANVEIKHVDLDDSMIRAIAKQAEAERSRRAKVIHAEGEMQAAEKLTAAAAILEQNPQALQLRYLQTLTEIAPGGSSTIVFPLPMDLIMPLMGKKE